MKKYIEITIFLLFSTYLLSFFKPVNPVDVSIGDNFVVSEMLSMLNPANVGSITSCNIYAMYTNLYNTEDVHYSSVYFVYPSVPHFFGVNINLLMFSNVYYESLSSISYAQKLKNFVFGSKLKFYYTKISTDFDFVAKEVHVVDTDVGVCYETKKIVVSLLFENVLTNKYRFVDQDVEIQKLKFVPYLGLKYTILEGVKIFLQKNIAEFDKIKTSVGLQVEFKNQFFLRTGVNENNLYSLGFGIVLDKLRLDFSSTFSKILGYNLIFGIGYKI